MKLQIKILLVLFVLTGALNNTKAQSLAFLKANELYIDKSYAEAITKYEEVLVKDYNNATAILNIADCYRLTNNNEKAVFYYAKAVTLSDVKPITKYYYAQALMKTGNYDLAKTYFAEYNEDNRGKTMISSIEHINDFFKDSAYYHISKVAYNSPKNDFSPVIYNNTDVVFVSSRFRTQLFKYTHSWTDNNFYFLYVVKNAESSEQKKPLLFAKNIQIKYNDGPICFNADSKTIYFTRNNLKDKKAVTAVDGDVKLNMYQAEYDAAKKTFTNIINFPYNSNDYNCAHPSISPDGSRLYFSSDMPGGNGGMDIWMCRKSGDSWGAPENLGKEVNTPGNDIFPYVFDMNTLYFSSDGLEGIGGLDIYYLKLNTEGMAVGKPKNMGAPLNSMSDDFSVVLYPDGKKGYFSSNRTNNDFNDDIYSFTVNKPEKQPYKIFVKDSISKQLLASSLSIKDVATGEVIPLNSDNGEFVADLYPDHTYTINANAKGHKTKENITYLPLIDVSPFEILLAPEDNFVIKGFVYEKGNKLPIDSALVLITDDKGIVVCEKYITNAIGNYTSCKLKPNTKYTITASKSGYFANSVDINSIPPTGLLQDIFLDKIVIGKAIKIDNIYFDLGKWNIRPDAALELDKIVILMQENPDIIIELSSHTDCRGSAASNMTLSDKRAKSSAAYIISKGIDPKRITGKGYGETKLLNDCKCEGSVKSDCSEEIHQQNRRTEFKVTGFVKGVGNVKVDSKK